jgi:ribosomal protein S18 acetylase RimI-like enzyme
VLVVYPEGKDELQLIKLLSQSLPEIENFAKETRTRQIKVLANPSWINLASVGLKKATHYMIIYSSDLTKIATKDYPVVNIINPAKIKNLIEEQFVYHCRRESFYFTGEIKSRARWFIDMVKEKIKKKEGVLLGATVERKIVGFLYGEPYESEGGVDELFVQEKYRGRDLGSCLLRRAGEEFLTKGFKNCGLFTGTNIGALGFYEKLGFKKKLTIWIKNL